MPSALVVLTVAAALGAGLVAGFFFAFSTTVMPALGRVPAPQGVVAMQEINVVVLNPLVMTALFGTAMLCLASIIAALVAWDGAHGAYVVAGSAVYLIGTIGVTMAANVPRNDALAALDADGADAAGHWARYLSEWTTFNHVRTVAALIASGLFVGALCAA